jgi:hypothetical protein
MRAKNNRLKYYFSSDGDIRVYLEVLTDKEILSRMVESNPYLKELIDTFDLV